MGAVCGCLAGQKGDVESHRAALDALVKELLEMRTPCSEEPQLRAEDLAKGDGFAREQMERDIKDVATAGDIRLICSLAARELLKQPSMFELEGPINIVGDLHGQFQDLLRIFNNLGTPPSSRFLFLGDYVDRGPHSLEVIVILLSMKLLYPESVFLLRGNHECEGVSMIYGFYKECQMRYSAPLWKSFIPVFDAMPLAAIVQPQASEAAQATDERSNRILCVHAGLSPALNSIEAIGNIRRPCKVQSSQIVSDLVWSDPSTKHTGWAYGDRGVSCTYGMDVASAFLQKHGLSMLVRAHEVVDNGYALIGPESTQVATVFSVPGYAGVCTNDAAVLHVDQSGEQTWHILPYGQHAKDRSEAESLRYSVRFHQRGRHQMERLLTEDLIPPDPESMPHIQKETLQDRAEEIISAVGDSFNPLRRLSLDPAGKRSVRKSFEAEASSSNKHEQTRCSHLGETTGKEPEGHSSIAASDRI